MKQITEKEKKQKRLRKKRRKLLLVIAAVTLLVMAAGYTVFIAPTLKKEQWVYKEEQVQRGTLKAGVTESGSLTYGITSVKYGLDLDVSDEDDGSSGDNGEEETAQKYLKIEKISVAQGQRIRQGDALITFTADSVSGVRLLLKNALAEAKKEYAEAQAAYNLSMLEAKNTYDSTKLDEKYASSIYQQASRGVDNEIAMISVEINQCIANADTLQKKVDEATEAYNEAWKAFKDAEEPNIKEYNTVNFMTMQTAYLNLKTAYDIARTARDNAIQAFEDNTKKMETLTGDLANAQAKRTLSQMEAEEAYQESTINGGNAENTYNAKVESLKETLSEAEAKKEKRQKQLDDFEAFVGTDGCLYAKKGGIVTEVTCEEGKALKTAGTLLSYAAPEDMTISVDVAQEDIVVLKVGDKVDITFVAYEGIPYVGNVQSINTTATSEDSNTVSYTAVIAVEGDTSLLYGGMTADIIFVTDQREDVVYISRKALVEENGKTCVYYKNALGERELKEVEKGLDNGVDVEILSGLKEGDTIYLASRVSSEDTVKGSGQEGASSGTSGDTGTNMPQDGNTGKMPGGQGGFPGGGFPGGNAPGNGFPDGFPSGGFPGGIPNGGFPGGGQ